MLTLRGGGGGDDGFDGDLCGPVWWKTVDAGGDGGEGSAARAELIAHLEATAVRGRHLL